MKAIAGSKKRFDREYKMDAARMVVDGGRTIVAVSADIGVCKATVRAWVATYKASGSGAFPGSGNLSPAELQLKQANEEIRKLKMQVGFLKKTMAYFVEQPQ